MASVVQTSRRTRKLVQRGKRAQASGKAAAVLTVHDHVDGPTAVLLGWDDPKEVGPAYAYPTGRWAVGPIPYGPMAGELWEYEVDMLGRPRVRDGVVLARPWT